MKCLEKQINKIITIAACLLSLNLTAAAQIKKQVTASRQLTEFRALANDANINFLLPAGFREVKAVNNENFSFDYAMIIPGQDFEVWFSIQPLKQNWLSYERAGSTGKTLANPDSTYNNIGKANAIALSGDNDFLVRTITSPVLEQYNADAGKTYLVNLIDLPETRHYKYALLISLQKNRTGNLLAVCLSNEKGPRFFKNINRAKDSIKFR